MAFISPEHIEGIGNIFTPFDKKNIKSSSYEMSLGGEVYMTDSPDGKVEYLNDENPTIKIKPGQFALLLTEEQVSVPTHLIAFISIKAKYKFKGLVNISGFHVDPGYQGKLLFSVYNAGPGTIVIRRGKPYFIMWFAQLTQKSKGYEGKHKDLNFIPPEKIEDLSGDVTSPNELLKMIKEMGTKKDRNFGWLRLITAIAITVSLKLLWDRTEFDKGYQLGLNERTAREEVRNEINLYNVDSLIDAKIDSILATQLNAFEVPDSE